MTPQTSPAADSPARLRKEAWLGLGLFGFLFMGLGGWAATARLDAAVVAQGVVRVAGLRQSVEHREGGLIVAIKVKEGERVAAGQTLAILDSGETRAFGEAMARQEIELIAARARLEAEIAGKASVAEPLAWSELDPSLRPVALSALAMQRREFALRAANLGAEGNILQERKRQAQARIEGLNQQILGLRRQDELIAEELEGLRTLYAKGLAPATRVRAAERARAELAGRKAQMEAEIATAQTSIGEQDLQRLRLVDRRNQDNAEQIRSIDLKLSELRPKLTAVTAQLERLTIKAPTAGRVFGLSANTVGATIQPGERLMEIVPENEDLVIEARLPVDAADDLTPGQTAQLRLRAYQGREMPILRGQVIAISADRLIDEKSGASYFRAEISAPARELDRIVSRDGAARTLKAGQPVDVVIPLRARTALAYLVEPLTQSYWQSMREE
jgi:HlyD family secretion protein